MTSPLAQPRRQAVKLSTRGRYAVMAMADLARHSGNGKGSEPVRLSEIATACTRETAAESGAARDSQLHTVKVEHDARPFERVHAPMGLDIGALSPEEIAVSIVAELIAVRRNAESAAHKKVKLESRPAVGAR